MIGPCRFLRRCALAVVACLSLLAMRPAGAEPALWVVRDADSTVYLFGTIHVLRPETEWWSAKLQDAFASADELWIETDEGSTVTLLFKVMRYGMDFTTPLSSRLTVEQRGQLATIASAGGLDPRSLERMRPWLAAVTLSTMPMMAEGYDQQAGADNTLERWAKESGKPRRTLESVSEQLRFFADLPPEAELAMLTEVLARGPMPVDALDDMVAAWAGGDEAGVEKVFSAEEFDPASPLYDVLIRQRNLAWAGRIKTMMEGAGTSFIAVGAGHLVGPDSVQAALAGLGLRAERL